MALYNFTLTLSGVTSRTVGLEDALHAAGCAGDALVCFTERRSVWEFDRERDSLEQAILSAIADIESLGSECASRIRRFRAGRIKRYCRTHRPGRDRPSPY